jgi:energy-converting hydrogenase Eha subunit G
MFDRGMHPLRFVITDALGIILLAGPCQYLRYYLILPGIIPLVNLVITSELIRAARALLRWEQRHLAEASSVSLPTIKRLEAKPGILVAHSSTVAALRGAFEAAGVEFTNGDQPGVRLRRVDRKR